MFVLDTNTAIYFFKGQGDVAHHLLAQPPSAIFLPTVVIYELEVGIAKSTDPQKRRQQLKTLIDAVTVLPFGIQEARIAGRTRAELEQKGTPIGRYDILIAATALARGATLVTHNTREFNRVAGLQLQDWY
jgi:tRNA(fMet)-specific endonuclease VapC